MPAAREVGVPAVSDNGAKALALGGGTFVVAMALWYLGAIHLGWGEAESRHDPDSVWMYVRRASLIGMAVLLPIVGGTPGFRSFGFRASYRWWLIALVVGLLCGLGNRGGYRVDSVALIAGAALHTFAVELYFRGYWIRLLEQYSKRFWPPILVSAVLYGLYQLTVFVVMVKPPWQAILLALMFTILGVVFGYGMRKSGAFVIAFVMHFVGVLDFKSLL